MKVFLKFIVFVAVVGAAVYLGKPYLEKFLDDRKATEAEAAEAAEAAKAKEIEEAPSKPVEKVAAKPTPPAKPDTAEIDKEVEELYPAPAIPPLVEMVKDWTFIPERSFPRKLVTTRSVNFELRRDGTVIGSRGVPAGGVVIAKAFSDGQLTINPEGSELITAKVEIDATNLKESIQEGYDLFVEKTEARVVSQRKAEKERMIRMAKDEVNRKENLVFKMMGWSDGSHSVFEPMKASLAAGDVEGYTLKDALRFRWLGTETVEGVEYGAGLVELYSTTIFGIFPTEGKALVRNGKVEKWVDPVDGGKVSPYVE